MQKKKIIIAIVVIAIVVILIAVIRNRAKQNSQNIPSTVIRSSIPNQVLQEDPSDWEGDILTYQGVKYTVVDGKWVHIN